MGGVHEALIWIFQLERRGQQWAKFPVVLEGGLSLRETPSRITPQAFKARENLGELLQRICLRAEGSED